jgi:hypothetical protein
LKLATAALQKHKGNQLLRVLKALALHRLDKSKEALEVLNVPKCPLTLCMHV